MSRWKIAAAALAASWSSAPAHAATSVSLPGSFNTEIGCASDWDPTCAQAQLSTLGSGLWYGAYHFPTGSYEYKVAYDQDWTVNYGAGGVLNGPNMSLDVTDPATVYFRHIETTRLTVAQLTPFGPMGPPSDRWLFRCPEASTRSSAARGIGTRRARRR